jgi:uncharacterized protein YjbI with pentapeptide repeats
LRREKMKFEIKSRFSGSVLFECEAESMKFAVEMAVNKRANLAGANLSDANLSDANLAGADLSDAYLRDADLSDAYLRGADLSGADLSDANLRGADLSGADLSDANFSGADLRGAYLRGANFSGADLRGAYLAGADLSGADLRGADLSDANLSGANLRGANLAGVKADYLSILSLAKHEVVGLYKALLSGRIDGSSYSGECACLVGTVANLRHEDHKKLGIDLRPDSSRPAERWFLNIRKGDTPENNQVSAITKEWTEEFAKEHDIKLPVMQTVWSES